MDEELELFPFVLRGNLFLSVLVSTKDFSGFV